MVIVLGPHIAWSAGTSDAAYKKALDLSGHDIVAAMNMLDSVISKNPGNRDSAKLYFLMGKLSHQYAEKTTQDDHNEYADAHAGQFVKFSREVRGGYGYNGYHFALLLKKF